MGKLLASGNEVLLTTKPRVGVVECVCEQFAAHRRALQFRFTIGSRDDAVLRFWEQGGQSLVERLEALELAAARGFKTSVSIEPFLDAAPGAFVEAVTPHVTESIWTGKDELHPRKGVAPADRPEYQRLRAISGRENIRRIVTSLHDHPLVRWKDSIVKMFLRRAGE